MIEYPFPVGEEMIDEIHHGTHFVVTHLDMPKAHSQQLVVDKQGCLTIRASRSGLILFKVLPLGISSVEALLQRQMKELLEEDLLEADVKVHLRHPDL